MDRYVKLYAKTLDNPIVTKDADHIAIWVYLLLNATYRSFDTLFGGKRITLLPGQLVTGRRAIAKRLHVDEFKVQRVLSCFETAHQIAQQTTPRNRLVTLLNWSSYQSDAHQNANNCTPTAHIQEGIEDKEDIYTPDFDDFWSRYPRRVEKPAAFKCWKTRLREGHKVVDLLAAADAYATQCRLDGTEQRFIKHPKTFLGPGKSFLDALEAPVASDGPDFNFGGMTNED